MTQMPPDLGEPARLPPERPLDFLAMMLGLGDREAENDIPGMPIPVPFVLNEPQEQLKIEMVQAMATDKACAVTLVGDHSYIIRGKKNQGHRVVDRTYVTQGVALRDPKDKPDDGIGLLLATGRALESMAHKILREAHGRVKHADDVRADQRAKRAKMKTTQTAPRKRVPKKVAPVKPAAAKATKATRKKAVSA